MDFGQTFLPSPTGSFKVSQRRGAPGAGTRQHGQGTGRGSRHPGVYTCRLHLENSDADHAMPVVFRPSSNEVVVAATVVPPSSSATVNVAFMPRVEGEWKGLLRVSSNLAAVLHAVHQPLTKDCRVLIAMCVVQVISPGIRTTSLAIRSFVGRVVALACGRTIFVPPCTTTSVLGTAVAIPLTNMGRDSAKATLRLRSRRTFTADAQSPFSVHLLPSSQVRSCVAVCAALAVYPSLTMATRMAAHSTRRCAGRGV